MSDKKYKFGFVMDQQVGLKTLYLNLQDVVNTNADVDAKWIPVTYSKFGFNNLFFLPKSLRGSMSGVQEIKQGVEDYAPYDAILWGTWAAKYVPRLLASIPSFQIMDMTPQQMTDMGHHYGYSGWRTRLLKSWKTGATKKLYSNCQKFFPWSNWVAQSLCNDYGVPPEKVQAVSPGVDTNIFVPKEELRSNQVVRILFVGGDFHRKGGDYLMRWAKETQVKQRWEIHFVTRDAINVDAPNLLVHHNVSNNSPQLIELYQKCDIFALPTRADCYSIVGMEAQSCGLPVIISNIGGISEVIDDGKTGFLVGLEDYATFAARLDTLVDDEALRRTMGSAARTFALQKHDCHKNMNTILAAMKRDCLRS